MIRVKGGLVISNYHTSNKSDMYTESRHSVPMGGILLFKVINLV